MKTKLTHLLKTFKVVLGTAGDKDSICRLHVGQLTVTLLNNNPPPPWPQKALYHFYAVIIRKHSNQRNNDIFLEKVDFKEVFQQLNYIGISELFFF